MKSNQTITLHDVKSVRLLPVKWALPSDSSDTICWRELEVQHAGGTCLIVLHPQRQGKELQLQVLTEGQIML